MFWHPSQLRCLQRPCRPLLSFFSSWFWQLLMRPCKMSLCCSPSIGLCEYKLASSAAAGKLMKCPMTCHSFWTFNRDRLRTTNNMLGDCYCAAVVEHLSRKELMACDAINFYQDTSSRQVSTSAQRLAPELIVVVESKEHNNNKVDKCSSKRQTARQKQ